MEFIVVEMAESMGGNVKSEHLLWGHLNVPEVGKPYCWEDIILTKEITLVQEFDVLLEADTDIPLIRTDQFLWGERVEYFTIPPLKQMDPMLKLLTGLEILEEVLWVIQDWFHDLFEILFDLLSL